MANTLASNQDLAGVKATADTAASNASTALSTANTANTNASTALSTANTANTNANTALAEAITNFAVGLTHFHDFVPADNATGIVQTFSFPFNVKYFSLVPALTVGAAGGGWVPTAMSISSNVVSVTLDLNLGTGASLRLACQAMG